ncbi:MAG: hypothetical protein R2715_21075 [Ilumatobacteraceae bacterium]
MAGVWVLDHVAASPFGGTRMGECFTLLGALAVAFPHVELGPLVLDAAARPVAVSIAGLETVALVAGARLRIGIGAGPGPGGPFAVERDLLESPPRSLGERHARVESLVAGIRSSELLADRSVVIGANSTALSAVAGRLADGLNVSVDHPRRDEFIRAALDAAGDRRIQRSAWARWRPELADPASPDRRALTGAGFEALMLAIRPAAPTW